MQIEFINKKIENYMTSAEQAEHDNSYVIKETNALRHDFLKLEKKVLVERYPQLEKTINVV